MTAETVYSARLCPSASLLVGVPLSKLKRLARWGEWYGKACALGPERLCPSAQPSESRQPRRYGSFRRLGMSRASETKRSTSTLCPKV